MYTHTIKVSARPHSKMKHKPSLQSAWDTQNSVLTDSRGAFQFTALPFVTQGFYILAVSTCNIQNILFHPS